MRISIPGTSGTGHFASCSKLRASSGCEVLGGSGPNKDARRDTLETPMHFAVEGNRYVVVLYLIAVGADINTQGARDTPLQFARKLGRSHIAQLLVARGGKPWG